MRTEAQKKVDKAIGMESLEYVFDKEKVKIMQKGIISREFDPEAIKQGLEEYRNKLSEMKAEKEKLDKRMEELKPLIEDHAVKDWVRLKEKAAKVDSKKKVEERLAKLNEELVFHADTFADQVRLVKEYDDWKAGQPEQPKQEIKEEPKEAAKEEGAK